MPTSDAAVLERDRRLESVSDNFPEGALYQYTATPDGRRLFTYLGGGFGRIFGTLPPELPADVAWLTARIHPDDEPAMAAAGERSLRELSRFDHEARIRSADGTERWVSFRSQPRLMPDGSIVSDGIILDITERRRAEESTRRRATFHAALNETTLELLGRRNVNELLQALAARASTLLNSPHAEISLLEDDVLVVRAHSTGRDYVAGDRVPRSEHALSWRAIDTRTPVLTEHYDAEPDGREVYRARGIRSAAVFPIMRGTEVFGVLGLAREQAGAPYSEQDIEEGTLLAQMAALVLHNAAIHEEAVREAEARTTALRESEMRFRAVFDRSPMVLALVSLPDGRIEEVNAACLKTFGYRREEMLGHNSLELGLWVDPALRKRYLELVDRTGSVSGFEAQMRRKDGTVITVLHFGCLITIGGRRYTLSANEDITARKQSEDARDRSLALMRATLESTADGILVVNADGRIETYNRNFAEMWRLDPEDIDAVNEERVIHTILDQLAEPELFLVGLRDLYSGSEDEGFDVLTCKDGRVFERTSRPQLIGSRPLGRVWSFRDITESRRAEAALRESEERFRVLAEVSPAGIFSSDPAGRCTFVNRRWCELAGMTPEEARGEGWTSALHPEDRARVLEGWDQAVQAGHSSAAEFRFLRPDGTVTWLVGQSRAQMTPDGRLAGYVGTITDVTSLKRAEEERTKNEAALRQARKMESLGTLAGGIAHDFNNILTGAQGFLDLARLELPPDHPALAWLDRIAVTSHRARELVRQILTFSRKNEGARVPQRLHVVVGEALRLLRSTLPPMVELEPRIIADAPPVLADANQIHQVVLNLCTNAWHAMPPRGGRIIVTLEGCTVTPEQAAAHPELRPGSWVRLSVVDNGAGIDAATMEHIFEPFYTTKETGAGTGLGLAVVHGIVKSHEGAILVRSEPGQGSTFEVYLPAVAVEVPSTTPAPPDVPRGNGEHVLVVDDDAVSGFAIEKMIESLGYRVTRCTRPEDALTQFAAAAAHFDLVVSDLAMPGMNGAELIEHLVRIRPEMPCVVVTGYLEAERQRLLARSPARAVLRKPVGRDELSRVVAEHVTKR